MAFFRWKLSLKTDIKHNQIDQEKNERKPQKGLSIWDKRNFKQLWMQGEKKTTSHTWIRMENNIEQEQFFCASESTFLPSSDLWWNQ